MRVCQMCGTEQAEVDYRADDVGILREVLDGGVSHNILFLQSLYLGGQFPEHLIIISPK